MAKAEYEKVTRRVGSEDMVGQGNLGVTLLWDHTWRGVVEERSELDRGGIGIGLGRGSGTYVGTKEWCGASDRGDGEGARYYDSDDNDDE